MSSKPIRVYWDSCVYIACIQQEAGRFPLLREILQDAQVGAIRLVASTLVIAEVAKLRTSPEPRDEQARLIQEFFENDFISVYSVDRQIAEDAAKIGRYNVVSGADAIHLATAIRYECVSFQTYDGESGGSQKLRSLNGRVGAPRMAIELPRRMVGSHSPDQRSLFPDAIQDA